MTAEDPGRGSDTAGQAPPPSTADIEWPEDDVGIPELPPNRPPGLLGESPPNLLKVDTFEPDGLNAGLVQESSYETRWLTIILLYLLVITIPVAAGVLWRSKSISRRAKIIATIAGVAGIVAVLVAVRG